MDTDVQVTQWAKQGISNHDIYYVELNQFGSCTLRVN